MIHISVEGFVGVYTNHKNGILINADVNAAYNIIRKVFSDAFVDGIEGVGLHPVRLNLFDHDIE